MALETTQVNATLSEAPSETHGAPPPSANDTRTIKVAIANDYELVVAGVAALLAPYRQIEIVELAANRIPRAQADIILFDTYGHRDLGMNRVKELVNGEHGASVVVYTFEFEPGLVDRALSAGVRGYLDKRDSAQRLVAALERVAAGEIAVSSGGTKLHRAEIEWPGRSVGLSARESELLPLLAEGLKNNEIAEALYLSVNTVKTHLKDLYRKLGASNRAQAVAAAAEAGLLTRRSASPPPDSRAV
jgi:two-component system, NarL family, response regulator LiaR